MWIPTSRRIPVFISSFQRIPVNLTQGGGIRSKGRSNITGECTGRQGVELLQNSRSAPVEFNVLLENDIDT